MVDALSPTPIKLRNGFSDNSISLWMPIYLKISIRMNNQDYYYKYNEKGFNLIKHPI